MPTTRQIPADAMRLRLGNCEFAAPEDPADAGTKATCKMTARSGKPVMHPYLGPIYHDFAGMRRTRDRLNLDFCHNPRELLGYIEDIDVSSGELKCNGTLFSAAPGDRAAEVMARAAQGQPYECSIKFDEGSAEELRPNATALVNGQLVTGPAIIFRQWTLRGVALCPYGMDPRTATEFAADESHPVTITILPPKEGQMSDTEKTAGDIRQELMSQAKDYHTRFGAELGAKWFAESKPLVDCYGEFVASLQASHAAEIDALRQTHAGELAAEKTRAEGLQGAVTELTARIEALGNQGGESAPVSGGPAGGKDGAPDKAGEYANVLPKNLARLAAGIKLPSRS